MTAWLDLIESVTRKVNVKHGDLLNHFKGKFNILKASLTYSLFQSSASCCGFRCPWQLFWTQSYLWIGLFFLWRAPSSSPAFQFLLMCYCSLLLHYPLEWPVNHVYHQILIRNQESTCEPANNTGLAHPILDCKAFKTKENIKWDVKCCLRFQPDCIRIQVWFQAIRWEDGTQHYMTKIITW